jgi:hypothetical protein
LATKIDLSRAPYHDNFKANNHHHRVEYRAGVPVQVQELNTSQSILQDQIEKFGRHIFTDGSVVEKCELGFTSALHYIKIRDTWANGSAFTISNFVNNYVESSNGLRAQIYDVDSGSLAAAPDLNTLYINYLTTANDNVTRFFGADQVLTLKTAANTVIGQLTTANTTVSGNSNYNGFSFAVNVSEGTIFSEGFFVGVEPQQTIVTKYSNIPDGVSVGFVLDEDIITPEQDSSLLDNAAGSENYAAPGAHRLKLTPTLAVQNTSSVSSSNNFFSLVKFVEGNPVLISTDPNYATLGKELARRTDEESGSYVISPFNMRTLTRYDANNVIDTGRVRLEIDPGLAYIHGYRVETVGKLVGAIRKGTDLRYLSNQVLTVTMGNYVYVGEFAGHWSFTTGAVVSLRDATAQAVTVAQSIGNSIDSLAAPGNEIGQAKLLSIQFDNGTQETPTAQYRVYLFDITMNTGNNFKDIRSLYTITSAKKGFGDTILDASNNTVLFDNSLKRLIYPLTNDAASAVKNLKNNSNNTVTQFDFQTSSTIAFSNTGVGVLTVPSSGVGGINQFPYGLGALDSVSERDFLIIVDTGANTANLTGRVTPVGSNVQFTIGQTSDFVATDKLSVGDLISVGNSTDYQTRRILTVNSSFITVANAFTNSYANAAFWQNFTVGQVIPVASQSGESITISGTPANTATIALNKGFTNTFNATVYYNVRRTAAVPASKQLMTSVFVKIDCTANTTGPYCLGLPDIYQVTAVYRGTTFANTNPDVKASFTFDSGQTDMYYGLASITPKIALTAADRLLVQLSVYKPSTSTGAGFFSVESYPVDDTGLTANSIFTQFIGGYRSRADGTFFNFRNSIDFRFYASNTAAYSNTIAGATINPANTLALNTSAAYIPALDSSFSTDVHYYLGRRDRIGMSITGELIVVAGTPSESPTPAASVQNGIDLALMNIPPYPSLTQDDVRISGSYYSVVTFEYMKNRRYTMKDIGSIDQRLSQVEYWSSLNTLEQTTKNLLIPSNTGNNRFKNGILVDPFNDHSIGDTTNTKYNIAIDADTTEARPVFTQQLINLVLANSSPANTVMVSTNGRLILLQNQKVAAPYLFQAFATQLRSPSQDTSYRWAGSVSLTPEGDYNPDVTINPDVIVNLQSYTNFMNVKTPANSPQLAWSTQWGTWKETGSTSSTTVVGGYGPNGQLTGTTTLTPDQYYALTGQYTSGISVTETDYIFGGGTQTTTTTTNEQRTGVATASTANTTTYQLGAYVTDVSLQPFIRPQQILFTAHGLKPNQRMWTYFDDTPISQYCRPIIAGNTTVQALGSPMITDGSGSLTGSFIVPSGKFRTGERKFRVLDISDLVTQNNILLSSATSTFFGTNLTYAKNNIELQTTQNQNYSATVTDTQAITSSSSGANPTNIVKKYVVNDCNCDCACACDGSPPPGDPCAQSWKMPQERLGNQDIGGIWISAIDTFFERKDPVLGVTVQVRTMENGYPTTKVVPFGSKHLASTDVAISEDASLATTVVFDAPLLLKSDTEYCIIIVPDGFNPNYALWTAALGGDPDVTTGSKTFQNSFLGKFFTSSIDTGWSAYQQEDMKLNIYRLTFSPLDSVATFTNDDSEYLVYNSYLGSFETGETVYFSNGDFYTNGINVQSSNTTIKFGTNAAAQNTANFAANDKIFIASNTNAIAFVANVTSIVNSTALIIDATPSFSDLDCSIGHLRKNGLLFGGLAATINNGNTIWISNSTADATYYISANTRAIGSHSNASANIASVINVPYNTVMPKLAISTSPVTALTFSMRGIANSSLSYAADTVDLPIQFASDQSFYDQERIVMSKSNEMTLLGGAKSLKMYAHFQSGIEKTSPAIDTVKLGMLTVYNVINNDDVSNTLYTSEMTNNGTAIDRYISQAVILADGQDAEDLRVYVAAYKPAGTDVYVYARLQNAADPDAFSDKAWTPLFTTNSQVSSKTNLQDFIEYEYHLPTANAIATSAFLNANNSGIVRYTSNSGVIYDGYKAFSIKIVLISSGSNLVPRLQDMRAICLQI